MKKFNYYKFYLKETKSISDSCEKNADIIINTIIPYIISFKKNDKKNFIFNIAEPDFKVKDLLININLIKFSENVCNAVSYLTNSELVNNFLEKVEIKFNIFIKDIDDDFLIKIESIILHELLHIFQHYKLSSKNKFRPSYFSIGVIINQLRNKFSSEYITNILDLLYISIDHEIAANIHQYYYYLRNNKKYNLIINNIKKLEKFNTKVLSNNEINELNILKNHIYNCIIHNISNKNYLKKMNVSMWKEDNNSLFLIILEDYFHKKAKLLKNKINRIDKKLNKPISYDINETISNLYTDWNYMIEYDPYYFLNLLK